MLCSPIKSHVIRSEIGILNFSPNRVAVTVDSNSAGSFQNFSLAGRPVRPLGGLVEIKFPQGVYRRGLVRDVQ